MLLASSGWRPEMVASYHSQDGPTTKKWSMGWGCEPLSGVWPPRRFRYPLSGVFPPHLCPRSTFASSRLPPPLSGFTHPHVCMHVRMLTAPEIHTHQSFRMHSHTEKSGKSVPRLIELKAWDLAGHCVSELQLLAAVSALPPDRTVQAP